MTLYDFTKSSFSRAPTFPAVSGNVFVCFCFAVLVWLAPARPFVFRTIGACLDTVGQRPPFHANEQIRKCHMDAAPEGKKKKYVGNGFHRMGRLCATFGMGHITKTT